jgi:hypothetical protein
MQKIKQIMAGIVDPARKELATPSTISPASPISEKWIAALFKKLQARYGHKWTSAIEGIERLAVREWSQGLAGCTADQIKHGLDTWNNAWPPSLPEFQQACTGYQDPAGTDPAYCKTYGYNYSPEQDKAKLLPAINRTLALVEQHGEHMAKLRKALYD